VAGGGVSRDFPGTNSNYLKVTNPIGPLDYAGSTMTVFVWARPDTSTPGDLVAKELGAVGTRGWQLGKQSTNIAFFTFNSGGGTDGNAGVAWTTLGTAVWKAIGGRKNGTGAGAVALFIAGVIAASASASQANLNDSSADFTVGQRSNNDEPFDGQLAGVAVWNVALSDAEMLALAKGVSPQMIRRTSLIAHYTMWGTSTAGEADLSGNAEPLVKVGTVPAGGSQPPRGPYILQ
jgi:hypothetical protein